MTERERIKQIKGRWHIDEPHLVVTIEDVYEDIDFLLEIVNTIENRAEEKDKEHKEAFDNLYSHYKTLLEDKDKEIARLKLKVSENEDLYLIKEYRKRIKELESIIELNNIRAGDRIKELEAILAAER